MVKKYFCLWTKTLKGWKILYDHSKTTLTLRKVMFKIWRQFRINPKVIVRELNKKEISRIIAKNKNSYLQRSDSF